MAGYTRNDASNNIADGNIINASDLDGEFDAIVSAFNASTGHTHDGTSAEGAPIEKVGPVQDLVITATEVKPKTSDTLDLGTNLLKFKDLFIDGDATLGGVIVDNDGTIGSVSDTDAIAISSGGVVTFSQAPVINVENTTTNAVTDVLTLRTQSTGTPAVGIGAGMLFSTETAAGTLETGGAIRIVTTGLTPTAEEIDLVFYSMRNGSLTEAFRFDSINDSLSLADNVKATFGTGDDLQIYHDGSNSYIKDNGTGRLTIQSATDFLVSNTANTQNYIYAQESGYVRLYHSGSTKLETQSTGIDVTGTVTADSLTVGGNILRDVDTSSMVISGGTASATGANAIFYGSTSGNVNDILLRRNNVKFAAFDGATGDISFYEDTGTTAKFFWDASTERLGLGTTIPSHNIDVTSSQTASLRLDSTTYGADFILYSGATGADKFGIYDAAASAYRLIIDNVGNVGIGTSTPSDRLEVKGATSAGVIVISSGDTTITGNDVIGQLNFKDYDADAHVGGDQDDVVNIKAIALHESGGATAFDGSTNEGYALSFSTSKRPSANAAFTVSEAMRIDEDGNVGIGVAPSEKLEVYGTTPRFQINDRGIYQAQLALIGNDLEIRGSSGKIEFYQGNADGASSTNQSMTLDASGNLLVGTTDGSGFTTSSTNSGVKISDGIIAVNGAGGSTAAGFFNVFDDGTVLDFRKDGATVGSIAVQSGQIEIDGNPSAVTTVRFGTTATLYPNTDAVGDIGAGTKRFKDLYLSGVNYIGSNIYAIAVQNTEEGVVVDGANGRIYATANAHHDLNRTADGEIIRFRSATVAEGSISVSGTTVSYNGGHLSRWSQLLDNSRDETIVKGTVMTNLDEMAVWSHEAVEAQDAVYDEDGNVVTEAVEAKEAYTEDNEQLNKMAVSSIEGDVNVAGVFVNWDEDDDMNIAMTGDMVIRIAQDTTVQRGNLLMSAGDGTAKPQDDDIVRSKTIAKVTSTHVSHTYDDGSYLVPCVLMAC